MTYLLVLRYHIFPGQKIDVHNFVLPLVGNRTSDHSVVMIGGMLPPNSRRTQVFINSGDNSGLPNFLDAQNFVPFARIVRGGAIVKELNDEYGGKVNQGKAAYYGGEYFEKVFPCLSIIRDAKLLM